ncbi:MAG: hypothetical protein KDB03_17370 [Planctomycetales bacterium]|nr:hypothetical protein [Planctomycetales bacterium]
MRTISIYALIIPNFFGACLAYSQEIQVVLEKIEARRESLPPCRFVMTERGELQQTDGQKSPITRKYEIQTSFEETLFRSIEIMDNEGAGRGKRSAILRPHEVVYYDGASVIIQGLGESSGAYVFDPRTLGISLGPFENTDLSHALRLTPDLRAAASTSKESIGNLACSKIQIDDPKNVKTTFWVDGTYNVVRFEYLIPDILSETTISEYSRSFASGIIPLKTVTTFKNFVSSEGFELIREFRDYERISPKSFGYEDMNLNLWVPASDLRIKQRLGYWDGEKLTEEPTGSQPDRKMMAPPNNYSSAFIVFLCLFGVLVLWSLARGFARRT